MMSSLSSSAASGASPEEQLPLLTFWQGHDTKMPWEGRLIYDDPDELLADATLSLMVHKRATGVELVGSLAGSVRVPCQQCTGEVWVALQADVRERFMLSSLAPKASIQETQQELSDDDFYEVVDIRYPLNMRELVRQLILVSAPNTAPCNQKSLKKCPNYLADQPADLPCPKRPLEAADDDATLN